MARGSVSRREFMKGAAVAGGGVLLAGCAAEPAAPEAVAESAPMVAMTAEEILTPAGLMPGSPDHAKGWTTDLPDLPEGMPLNPPVTITSFTRTDADTRFQGDDDIYDNISLRYIKALFGIEYDIPWTYVQGEERDQKMNLAMAAGDIPDLMPGIGLAMFQDMVAGELVADITDVYEATAHPKWVKESQAWGDNQLWAYAEVDGRKMAFPSIAQAGQDEQILFIRTDWLDKVGMDAPTTLEEMEAVAEAFVTNDLGAGPPGTTVGVMASRDLQSWYGGLGPVFGGFGVLPSWYYECEHVHEGRAGRSEVRRHRSGDEGCLDAGAPLVREEDPEPRLFHEGLPGEPHGGRGQPRGHELHASLGRCGCGGDRQHGERSRGQLGLV